MHARSKVRLFWLLFLLLALAAPPSWTPAQADPFKSAKKKIRKGAKDASDAVEDGATDVYKDTVKGTQAEIKAVSSTARKTYDKTLKEGESAYRQTVAKVHAGIDAAKEAALRAAGE